jgi:hypothetical protein
MARTLKKNWPLILLVTLAVVASGSIWWLRGGQATAADQAGVASAPPKVAPGAPWVQPVLRRLGMTRDCLVALNVNKDQAQALRSAVRDWCSTNKASLAGAFAKTDPSREAGITQALAGLKTQLSAMLTPSQRASWQNLQQYPDLPIVYRLAAPDGPQRAKIQKLLQERWYAQQAAKTPAKQQEVQAAFDAGLRETLNASQVAMIDAYHGYCSTAAAATMEPAPKAGTLPIPGQQSL